MSKYTTQLRWIVEQEQGDVPYSHDERYIEKTYKKLGLDEYPIFDETYRQYLNDKIIDHFYFREIGFETVALFSWYMRRTLNEIMPYYNEMYVTQGLLVDPLTDRDASYRESWNIDIADRGKSSNANDNHARNVYQDTPMSLLNNVGAPQVENLDYATNVTYDDANGKSSGTRENDRNDAGWKVHDEKGRYHSQSYLLKEYRDVFKNIDMEVIDELETLFMGLW